MAEIDSGREKKRRSLVERVLVQGGIVLLLVVVAIEFRAQKGYSQSLTKLKELSKDGEVELPLAEVRGILMLAPSSRVVADGQLEKTVCYSWFSVFRNGQFRLNIVSTKTTPEQMLRYFTDKDPMTVRAPTDIVKALSVEEGRPMLQGSGGVRAQGNPGQDGKKSDVSRTKQGNETVDDAESKTDASPEPAPADDSSPEPAPAGDTSAEAGRGEQNSR